MSCVCVCTFHCLHCLLFVPINFFYLPRYCSLFLFVEQTHIHTSLRMTESKDIFRCVCGVQAYTSKWFPCLYFILFSHCSAHVCFLQSTVIKLHNWRACVSVLVRVALWSCHVHCQLSSGSVTVINIAVSNAQFTRDSQSNSFCFYM